MESNGIFWCDSQKILLVLSKAGRLKAALSLPWSGTLEIGTCVCAPVPSPRLSSCISIYMKLALSFGQNRGQLSFCSLCLPYGSPQWTRTIVQCSASECGPFRPSEGPKQCPLHRLNRRVHSRRFCFLPRFPPPFVLSLNPLSIIKGQDPEYQLRRIYIVLD